jgi:manganese oxidase
MHRAAPASIALALLSVVATIPATPQGADLGSLLATLAFEGGSAEDPCPGAATRHFDVVALQVPISYNHWGDLDPHGRLFVLAEDEAALRAQVADSLAKAGHDTAARLMRQPTRALAELGFVLGAGVAGMPNLDPVDVSPLVQPFVVRAHLGDCVQLNLTNKLPEPVSIHVHRAHAKPGQGMALGSNEPDLTLPGQSRSYVVYIPPLAEMEGAHFLHSHADARFHTRHGLFGAIVAEPPGTSWLGSDGQPLRSGQEAIIVDPAGSDFREFVLILHDEVELVDKRLNPLPAISPYHEYGPGSKAINLRSEPFMDRFALHDQQQAALGSAHDKSQGYGSYTYGDPGVFIPRSYVGDPVKFRLVNAGPGQHHVFHLHGGGDRWRASPGSDDTQFDAGLLKVNPIVRSRSERVDVQNVGPGESFNLEIEGGSGGVQQSVGDFLYHCHIVEHYVAGMWSFWRVFNTLQPGLAQLPDRQGGTPQAVDSLGLLGRTLPDGTVLDAQNVRPWIEAQLPARGVPLDADDAAVWDWSIEEFPEGPRYQGEPETTHVWPNYRSPTPGERPTLLFHPHNGRLAYPFLSPHLGQRPPFAPDHGPAPYLGMDVDLNHPDGLCPQGAPLRRYDVVALSAQVAYNSADVDPDGQVFVLAEDKAAVETGVKPAKNLIIRANQGDCVDVLLTSQLHEGEGEHSKVNMHIHLVQFDVQGSDGVITGRNYETSVRPAATTGTALAQPAAPGATTVEVGDASMLHVGGRIGLSLTEPTVELRRITAIAGNTLTLDAPLAQAHDAADRVGHEFVRYRWYADVELGMVYWHDHVDGLNSWRKGLFGGLVVEPHGSDWRHPSTGAFVKEGTVADIVSPQGSFREFVAQFQENSFPLAGRNMSSFNLRAAPFDGRSGNPLSSAGNGDPSTDLWRAYPGDEVVVRLLYGANANTRAVGTFAITGHRFPFEQHNPGSRSIDALSFGISSQHNLRLECGAGGCAALPGDYLYHMTQPELFRQGAWGILRVHGQAQLDLLPLPDNAAWSPGTLPQGPVRRYDVVALEANLTYNDRFDVAAPTKLFALASEEQAILDGSLRPHPLVLRALPGERVEVRLTNNLTTPVSLHAALVLASPSDGLGIPVGLNPDTTVAPGQSRTSTWFADAAVGVAYITSYGSPATDALDGLYGALVVEPPGSTWSNSTGMSADLTLASGEVVREHVLLYASDDPLFMGSVMPYSVDVRGITSVNYRTEPLAQRVGGKAGPITSSGDPIGGMGVHACQVNNDACALALPKAMRLDLRSPLASVAHHGALGTPETPILDARAGQRVVVRALGGAGDQLQVHALAGHWWARDPAMPGSDLVDAVTLGPGETSNAWFLAQGAGDHLWGSHREAFREAGAWGLLRVTP